MGNYSPKLPRSGDADRPASPDHVRYAEERPVTEADLNKHVSRLSIEIERVLDRIESHAGSGRLRAERPTRSDPVLVRRVKAMIESRSRRYRFFADNLFADPAWDILLDLYLADLEQRRTTVTSLCISAAVPPTTALRWITTLVDRDLLIRRPDKLDRRRVFIELSPHSLESMHAYFADLPTS